MIEEKKEETNRFKRSATINMKTQESLQNEQEYKIMDLENHIQMLKETNTELLEKN